MQLEPIIASKLKSFQDTFELTNIQNGIAFGKFVNHSILSVHQPDAFSADSEILERISVDGEWDTGIDGLAIVLNGLVVNDKNDIDSIMNKFRFVNVEFIFIQSKYKPNFDSAEFLKFIAGVRDFLAEDSKLPQNDKIKEAIELKKYILSDNFISKWDNNPFVKLYYVAMGRWRANNTHLLALAKQAEEDIVALSTFEKPEIHFVDSESLKTICDQNENRFDVTVATYDIMELTPVEGVENSCIAVCFGNELIKILKTETGEIRKSLFNDNVRDYQGENAVNNEMFNTIKIEPSKFILLNNGITIVCDEFKTSTKKITIRNPQIVNGCQTSHVIYEADKKGIDISAIPLNIKVISTQNINISNQIVRGTNRQSQVLEEAFETTRLFHLRLEEFFNAFGSDPVKIYYERRSKQYKHLLTIKNAQIINLQVLLHSFAGMMLNSPHRVNNSTLEMLKDFKGEIFSDNHSYLPYYAASLSFNQLELMFRDQTIGKELRSFKPHLLMMFREAVGGSLPPVHNAKLIDEHSQKIINSIKNIESFKQTILDVVGVFKKCRETWINDLKRSKDGMKDVPEFTRLLLQNIQNHFSVKTVKFEDSSAIFTGQVLFTLRDRNNKWYGFISSSPENIFFHEILNKGIDFQSIKGKEVDYKKGVNKENGKPFAFEVSLK